MNGTYVMRPADVLALAEQSRDYQAANVSLVFLADFAGRVAEAEREACARIAETSPDRFHCAAAIRARK